MPEVHSGLVATRSKVTRATSSVWRKPASGRSRACAFSISADTREGGRRHEGNYPRRMLARAVPRGAATHPYTSVHILNRPAAARPASGATSEPQSQSGGVHVLLKFFSENPSRYFLMRQLLNACDQVYLPLAVPAIRRTH